MGGCGAVWVPGDYAAYCRYVSYDLAVWIGPTPRDDDEAKATYRALVDKWLEGNGLDPDRDDPTPPCAIVKYVEALQERWPDDDDASPWASGPLINEAIGPIFYFPMVWSMAEEASAFAAKLAAKHGLVCFDPQLERLRPGSSETPQRSAWFRRRN